MDFGLVDFWLLDLAAGWFSFTEKNMPWWLINFFRHVVTFKKKNVWPETCFGVKIISFRELLKTSSRSLFRRRFWLLGGRCRQKSLGMVNACVRDRDAVVRVPFAVSKHYLCCYALVCAIVFATVWSGITADGRVSVKINCIWSTRAIGPTDTVRICSWCDHSKHICRLGMIFCIWSQERERTLPKHQIHVYEVDGSGKPGPWVHNCIFSRFLSCR